MTKAKYMAALLAAAALTAQPSAAYAAQSFAARPSQGAAFAGLNVRLPIGQARREKVAARLQLATSYTVHDSSTGAVHRLTTQGLELGASKSGKPAFYWNGQSSAEIEKRLGIGGSTKDALLIGLGVLLAAGVLMAVMNSSSGSQPASGQ